MFLPTTLQSAEQIVQTIKELKQEVPPDPLESDLISMADLITEEQKPGMFMQQVDVFHFSGVQE